MSSDLVQRIAYLTYFQNQFSYYTCLALGPVGLLSNLLNIAVCMRSKKLRQHSMGFYNPLMSSCNILVSIIAIMQIFPASIGQQDLLVASDYSCVFTSYFSRVFVQMSSWLNIMLTLDRTISITCPHKYPWVKNRRILAQIIGAMLLAFCGLNALNFTFGVRIVNNLSGNQTQQILSKSCTCKFKIVVILRDLIAQFARTVVPLCLEMALNSVLIYKLIKSRQNVAIQRSMYRDYKFSFTIVMLNILFFITQTPLALSFVYMDVLNLRHSSDPTVYQEELSVATCIHKIASVFASWMYVSVFFVNATFNRHFRHELIAAICALKNSLSSVVTKVLDGDLCVCHTFILNMGQHVTILKSRVSEPILVGFSMTQTAAGDSTDVWDYLFFSKKFKISSNFKLESRAYNMEFHFEI